MTPHYKQYNNKYNKKEMKIASEKKQKKTDFEINQRIEIMMKSFDRAKQIAWGINDVKRWLQYYAYTLDVDWLENTLKQVENEINPINSFINAYKKEMEKRGLSIKKQMSH